jgi:hypothetical protein
MSDYNRINPAELDRHITGHYGEDQFPPLPELATVATIRLEDRCPECEGERIVQHPTWRDWFAATGGDETKSPMPEPEIPEEIPCPECDGRGTILTPAGSGLLDFIRRYQELQ